MCNACSSVPTASTDAPSPAEAFAGGLMDTLNHAGLALMISVGHRTGLFDALSECGWTTSSELAEAAGLDERYVREWLGAMATGRIVEIDGDAAIDRFRFPEMHAEVLASSGMDMAKTFQWIATLAEVECEIVDCFRNGGGVPYEKFTRFHDVMADESEGSVVSGLHEHVMPLAPGIVEKLEAGIDVLDIGCGSGRAMCELARRFPRSRFTGYDICDPAIEIARANAREAGVTNLTFETRDVTGMHDASRFDLVTAFDVIHDQRDPAGVLEAVRRVLKPGATFLMQDIRAHSRIADNMDSVLCPFFYTISTMHCMTVSLAQGGAGLGTVWGEELAVEMLGAAGFEEIVVNTLDHDIMNNWYVMRTPCDAGQEAA